MNRSFFGFLLLILLNAAIATVAEEPFADLTFAEASTKAATDHKLIFIDFYTSSCGPCEMLDKNTLTDAEVIKLLKSRAVALKIDAEKELKLAGQYKIDAYPTLLLLKPDGAVVDRMVGYREPQAFIADFNAALSGKDAVARAAEAVTKAGKNDPMARLNFARALVEKQEYAAALKEYLWCFDHGVEADPSFVGVRVSFLLSDIVDLGQKHPPARQALETRRDADDAKLTVDSLDLLGVHELIRLNDALGQKEKNLAVFDRLPRDSKARPMISKVIIEQLLTAKRYQDVLDGVDPQADFDQEVRRINRALSTLEKASPMRREMEPFLRQTAVTAGSNYYEALAGVGKNDEATALAGKIRTLDGSPVTREKLIQRAERAGNATLVNVLKSQ